MGWLVGKLKPLTPMHYVAVFSNKLAKTWVIYIKHARLYVRRIVKRQLNQRTTGINRFAECLKHSAKP
jgi:hypothetical protein